MGNLFAVFNFLSSFGRNTLDTIFTFIPRNGCIFSTFNQLIYAFLANALEIISFPSPINVVTSRRFYGVWIAEFKKGANMFESVSRPFEFAYEIIIFISGFFVYCFHDFMVILLVKGERARELNPLCRLSARAIVPHYIMRKRCIFLMWRKTNPSFRLCVLPNIVCRE